MSGGRSPKQKGRVYEREFRKLTGAERVLASGAYGALEDDDDLKGDAVLERHARLRCEVKYRANGVLFGTLLQPPIDLVAVRTSRKRWYVLMELDKFMEVYDGGSAGKSGLVSQASSEMLG